MLIAGFPSTHHWSSPTQDSSFRFVLNASLGFVNDAQSFSRMLSNFAVNQHQTLTGLFPLVGLVWLQRVIGDIFGTRFLSVSFANRNIAARCVRRTPMGFKLWVRTGVSGLLCAFTCTRCTR